MSVVIVARTVLQAGSKNQPPGGCCLAASQLGVPYVLYEHQELTPFNGAATLD